MTSFKRILIAVSVAWVGLASPTQAEYVTGLDPNGDNYLSFRSGPGGKGFDEIDRLGPNTFVTVLQRQGGWLRVRLTDGREGWVSSRYIASTPAPSAPPGASRLPPEVRAAIEQGKKDCGDKIVLEPGFITRKDVNGDGVQDYILDYGSFICGDSHIFFCGSAGCVMQVFASMPDVTFVKVLDENVRELRFARVKGRPAMLLGLHGSACGRVGAEPCGVTLYWNGEKFSPAN